MEPQCRATRPPPERLSSDRVSPRNDQPQQLTAPPIANAIAFGALFLLSAAFLGCAYCMARALAGGFGSSLATLALAASATAAASIFLWWLLPFADFAEIAWIHLPADRRARRGECPHCAYPHEGRATCTECGRATEPLPAWTLSRRPVRRMTLILVPALVVSVGAGEAWCRLDESRFIAEARAGAPPYARARAFPAGFATMRADEDGSLTSAAWPEFERARDWTPAEAGQRERGLGWRERAATDAPASP
jgi:hypothetical protein